MKKCDFRIRQRRVCVVIAPTYPHLTTEQLETYVALGVATGRPEAPVYRLVQSHRQAFINEATDAVDVSVFIGGVVLDVGAALEAQRAHVHAQRPPVLGKVLDVPVRDERVGLRVDKVLRPQVRLKLEVLHRIGLECRQFWPQHVLQQLKRKPLPVILSHWRFSGTNLKNPDDGQEQR